MTTKTVQHVATNAGYLFFSQVITWILSFTVAILLPRHFGPSGIGQYHLASSLWNIMALLVGFGTDVIITREIAREQSLTSPLVTIGIIVRIIFHLVGYTAIALFANMAGYSAEAIQLIYLFGIANLIFQIGHIFSAALYGLEKMGFLSLVGVLTELVSTIGMVLLVLFNQSIVQVALVSIVAGIVRTSLLFIVLRTAYPLQVEMHFALVPWLLRKSATILGNRLVRNAYVQADVIFISLFVNDIVVGWYSAADTAFGSLLFIANIVATAFFPTLARLQEQSPAALQRLARQGVRWLLLVTVPLGFGTAIIATPLLVLVLGKEFADAGLVLSGFGLVVILTSLNIFFAQILIVMDRQNRLTLFMTVALLVTLPIDFFLIPWTQATWHNGALGGVIAYLITETFITASSLLTLPWKVFDKNTLFYGAKVLGAGIVMVCVVWPFRQAFILYPVAIGVATYALEVFILGLISKEEIELGRNVLQEVWSQILQRIRMLIPRMRKLADYLEK